MRCAREKQISAVMWIENSVAPSDHVKTSPMRQAQKWISHTKDFAGLRCAADDFFFSLELQRHESATTSTDSASVVWVRESADTNRYNLTRTIYKRRAIY